MPPPIQIESSIQLLVEGNDQRNFFEAYREHLSLPSIQIQNFGGTTEIHGFLKAFVNMAGFFDTVERLAIVRDAETSSEGAFQSVTSALRNAALSVPSSPATPSSGKPTTAVFVLEGSDGTGMLETLLCETFEGTPEAQCVDTFLDCVDAPEDSPKHRAHAYLVTTAQPQVSVGVAAKQHLWDFQHEVFRPLRDFLVELGEPTS